VAAAYLHRAGFKNVCVLERRHVVGEFNQIMKFKNKLQINDFMFK
jgi:hypothetical protein